MSGNLGRKFGQFAGLRRCFERADEGLEFVAERLPLLAIALDVASEAFQLFERRLLIQTRPGLMFLSWFHTSS